MYSFSRALVSAFFAWVIGVTVLVAVGYLVDSPQPTVLHAFRPPWRGAMHPYPAMETMAHIARWLGIFSFCVSFIICLMVIAPLLAQARPGSSLWRPAWLCPLAALATFLLIHFLILLPAAHMDYRLMEVIDWWLPIHFAAMGGVAAFTFSYATLMHGWVKKIAAPQPYVD